MPMAENPKIYIIYKKPSALLARTREILLSEYKRRFDLVYITNSRRKPAPGEFPHLESESLLLPRQAFCADGSDFVFGDLFIAIMDGNNLPLHQNAQFWKKVF